MQVRLLLGDSIKGFGEETRRGRRRHIPYVVLVRMGARDDGPFGRASLITLTSLNIVYALWSDAFGTSIADHAHLLG